MSPTRRINSICCWKSIWSHTKEALETTYFYGTMPKRWLVPLKRTNWLGLAWNWETSLVKECFPSVYFRFQTWKIIIRAWMRIPFNLRALKLSANALFRVWHELLPRFLNKIVSTKETKKKSFLTSYLVCIYTCSVTLSNLLIQMPDNTDQRSLVHESDTHPHPSVRSTTDSGFLTLPCCVMLWSCFGFPSAGVRGDKTVCNDRTPANAQKWTQSRNERSTHHKFIHTPISFVRSLAPSGWPPVRVLLLYVVLLPLGSYRCQVCGSERPLRTKSLQDIPPCFWVLGEIWSGREILLGKVGKKFKTKGDLLSMRKNGAFWSICAVFEVLMYSINWEKLAGKATYKHSFIYVIARCTFPS